MVVKGYYASICHGLTFLGALANMVRHCISYNKHTNIY